MTDRRTLERLIIELDGSATQKHAERARCLLATDAPAVELALSVAALVQASAADDFNQYTTDARRGAKVLAAAKAGHQAVHGTEKEKAARYSGYQKTVNEKHAALPHITTWRRLSELVAREHGCCSFTIRKHTKNPYKL